MINPTSETYYVCRIEDGGDGPKFEIDPVDQPGVTLSSKTPTGAWVSVIKAVNVIRGRETYSNSASGKLTFLRTLPALCVHVTRSLTCQRLTAGN